MLQKKYFDGVEVVSLDKKTLQQTLKNIALKIKAGHPSVEDIILFGSFFKGNFTPSSDVDIAVIVKHTQKQFIKRQDTFINYFFGIPLDVNVVVYTRQEIAKMLKEKNMFIQEVMSGIRL